MIPASSLGGVNHVTVANLNAPTGAVGISAFGKDWNIRPYQSITAFDPDSGHGMVAAMELLDHQ